jgi:hypothetical protein
VTRGREEEGFGRGGARGARGTGLGGFPLAGGAPKPRNFFPLPRPRRLPDPFSLPFLPNFAAFPSKFAFTLGPPVSFQLCLGSNPLKWKSTLYKE